MYTKARVDRLRRQKRRETIITWFEGIALFGFVMLLAGCAGNIAH